MRSSAANRLVKKSKSSTLPNLTEVLPSHARFYNLVVRSPDKMSGSERVHALVWCIA